MTRVKTIEVGMIPIPTDERITGMTTFRDYLLVFTYSHVYKVRRLKWWERILRGWKDKFKVEETDENAR